MQKKMKTKHQLDVHLYGMFSKANNLQAIRVHGNNIIYT
jgi:hypothetical protein